MTQEKETSACDARRTELGTVPVLKTSEYESPYYKYNSPVPGKIVILASSVYIDDNIPSQSVLDEVKECGFNLFVISGLSYSREISDALNRANYTGLKALVSHSHIYRPSSEYSEERADELCEETVKKYMNHPSFGGWSYPDEPKYSEMSSNGPRSLKHYYDIVKRFDPDHVVHMNLVGGVVEKFTQGHSYNQYMDIYQTQFLPALWSYDVYPMETKDGKLKVARDHFYKTFEIYALRQRMLNRPFWTYCQSVGFHTLNSNNQISFIHPNPKQEYLRYEAFSALGYGAQGIVYWTYHQRHNKTNDEGVTTIFDSAPIDLNGNRTDIWGDVQTINKEISTFNDIFFDTRLIDCKHTVNQYEGTCLLKKGATFGPFRNIESEEGGMGVQISHLSTNGKDYIVVVNHDVENEQTITLEKSYYKVFKLVPDGKGGYTEEEIDTFSSHKLSEGGYLIFRFK